MPLPNSIIIAAAGAGKTTRVVRDTAGIEEEKVLIVTYTQNNEEEIKKKFYSEFGAIPPNVTIQTWFTFLLDNFVRPYQNALYDEQRISGLAFVPGQSARGIAEANTRLHYFSNGSDIYSDKVSKFGVKCNQRAQGAAIGRLGQIYQHIYIDEVQDLAGYDLDIIELLFASEINITLVGDYRQATYRTNHAQRNSQYGGVNIIRKFEVWEEADLCSLEHMNYSYRCNGLLCTFADRFFPEAPPTEARNTEITGHEGIFIVRSRDLKQYCEEYENPQVLRYDRRTNCNGLPAMNFKISKGLTFDRVIIFPHGPLRRLIQNGNFQDLNDLTALYVAFTRARHSIGIVYDGNVGIEELTIYNE